MSNASINIASLSPEQRAALEVRLNRSRAAGRQPRISRQRRDSDMTPVSFGQKRLWLMDRLEGGSSLYNISDALRFVGRLNVAALDRTLGEIVRRHESLRTTFTLVDGEPLQVIAPATPVSLSITDIGHLPEADRQSELRRALEAEARRPFDLARGPLFRAGLIRLGETEHVLTLSMHHIVADGWSLGIFVRELRVLYESYCAGDLSPLPELPFQYADFAMWQRERLSGERFRAHLAYWKEKLDGIPEVLELPTDRPRQAAQSSRGAWRSFVVSKATAEALKALSRREGATLFMTLLAAFKTLLYRYSGQTDICVGTPIANRTRADIEGLIGFFVNMLVLRTDLSGDPSFRELLGRERNSALEAYAHQEMPFERLVEELRPQRNLSHAPLFQVDFALHNHSIESLKLPGLTVSPVGVETEAAKFELMLTMMEGPQGLTGSLRYRTDLFDHTTVERMAVHFQTLLDSIATDPDQSISRLTLLTESERSKALFEWNDTAVEYPSQLCVHELFEQAAEQFADNTALSCGGQRMSYRELNERANRLAHYLRHRGVGAESLVGVMMSRSLDMVVALLGVLKAGGAYVPLDPAYPAQRLAFMMEDAGVRLVLSESAYREQLEVASAEVALIDERHEQIAEHSAADVANEVGPDNLAYVIYTSGSTGRPKGVAVPHKGVVRLVKNNYFASLTSSEVLLQLAPVSFDASTFEIWGALLNGARLAVMREGAATLEQIAEAIRREGVTTMWLTAGLFHQMAEWQACGLKGVRQLLAGGDVLGVRQVRKVVEEVEGCEVINGYGPTESTTFATTHRVGAGSRIEGSVPIGKPIANTRVYVVDAEMEVVAAGVSGELLIAGDGLARGYLNRPELTAEKFIPDPFSTTGGERLYRTGDLARWNSEGEIEFLGRIDNQVKVRGYRIELGEIEAALTRHLCVREAVVVAREDAQGEKRLVGYVVAEEGENLNRSGLREYLRGEVPDYMVPTEWVWMREMPLTPNGKVDRRALPEPSRDTEEAEGARKQRAATPVEEVIAGIWEEVLGVEGIGVDENFFELGGHSLKATQIVTRLRGAFNVELPLHALFESATVANLARLIESYNDNNHSSDHPPLRPMPRNGNPPLSFSQERIWFLQQVAPDNRAYNFQATLRFKGPLDPATLHRSINEIIRRHEILRTTFVQVMGRPEQAIHPHYEASLPVVDLQSFDEGEREAEAARLIGREMREPFDLEKLPLIRWVLLRINPQEHLLLHIEHHLLHDGWSFNVFLRELVQLYTAFSAGEPSPLAELPIQFADFALWQREWLRGGVAEKQLDFWTKKLAGSPPVLELPLDRPRPVAQTFRGAVPRIDIPLDLCDEIRAFSRREGVSLFMTMMATFLALLHRYTGQNDLCIGSGIANRRWRETEGLIGMIINNVVLRTDLSGNPTFRELLGRVRRATLETYANQDVPFEKVVEALRPDRVLGHNPIYQAMFSFHDSPLSDLEIPGLSVSLTEGISNGSAKFDLSVIVIPRSEQHTSQSRREESRGITMLWEYSSDLFDAETIDRAIAHYQQLMEAVINEPGARISDLPMLTAAEREKLLVEYNDTAAEYPSQLCVHELFEQAARSFADNTALSCGTLRMTYREVNERANRLAHYLRHRGVGAESLVGVMMSRSLDMVVALLGVLKAGGAYVPLDPAYPAQRLAFMMEDAGVRLVLSESAYREQLEGASAEVALIDECHEQIAACPCVDVTNEVGPDNLAYVIYTSGSTGKPKGVAVPHSGLNNLVAWHRHVYGLTPTDRATQVAGLSFDASVWELWPYLATGASIHMPDEETRLNPSSLLGWLAEEKITISFLPTPLAEATLKERLPEDLSLRALLTGGDKLHRAPREPLPFNLVNHYGPTENTVVATSELVTADSDDTRAPSIGRPISNTRTYLLDQYQRPVATGVAGELYIGGSSLARGYLNRPELTAERFIPDSFSGVEGARLYRTGDLARYLPDGRLEFLGRIDNQVKVRGYRIELGEIESSLCQHPEVRECAVVIRGEPSGDKRLVGYVVAGDGSAVTGGELQAFLKERLPDYMLPSAWVVLDALPLTPNGKVDKSALPEPGHPGFDSDQPFVAPRTPVEEVVADIWAAVLGMNEISIFDSFFKLGGHSLLATQVVSRVREMLQIEIPIRSLFESPTIADFSRAVEEILIDEMEGMPEEEAEQLVGGDNRLAAE